MTLEAAIVALRPIFTSFEKMTGDLQDLLVQELRNACATREIADKVVAHMVRECLYPPVPADIYKAARIVNPPPVVDYQPKGWGGFDKGYDCPLCQDTGFVPDPARPSAFGEPSFAVSCSCRGGAKPEAPTQVVGARRDPAWSRRLLASAAGGVKRPEAEELDGYED